MKVTAIIATLFAGVALAIPTGGGGGGAPATPYDPCSGLYDTAQCCATDVLGVADLDCGSRKALKPCSTVSMMTDDVNSPECPRLGRQLRLRLCCHWTARSLLRPPDCKSCCPASLVPGSVG